MSHEDFARFVEKLGSDEEMQGTLKERFGELEDGVPADDLIDFAEEQGYSFSVEDVSQELSPEEMEGAVGGLGFNFLKFEGFGAQQIKIDYSFDTNRFNFIKLD